MNLKIFLLIIATNFFFPLHTMNYNNNNSTIQLETEIKEYKNIKPVAPLVLSMIHAIYDIHDLSNHISAIKFMISNDEWMMPKSAISGNKLSASARNLFLVVEGHNTETSEEFIIISPALQTILKNSSMRFINNKMNISTALPVIFNLLCILGVKQYNSLSQDLRKKESFKFAVQNMYTSDLKKFKNQLKSDNLASHNDLEVVELIKKTLQKRKLFPNY